MTEIRAPIRESRAPGAGGGRLLTGNRKRILQALYLYPASSVSKISRVVGLTPNTVKWHLSALKRAEFITEDRVDNKSVFYPCNYLEPSETLLLTVLNDDNSNMIFRKVFEKPGMTQKEIKSSLDLTQNTTGYFLRKLTHIGAVIEVQNGKFKHYYPSEKVLKRLEERKMRCGEYASYLISKLKSAGVETAELNVSEHSFSFKILHRRSEEYVEFQSNPFSRIIG
ncbi:MAG: helix-turn-helix domain-containing protein [Thermoplasmata archaeon]|uniref:Helix-turn-helix domain-containing protein n=1 Tax=Candidatus Sysuiplasma superficiale TaxID=2823368 RepID=A0A8J7YNR6_9ARCH|nr:helix-turn-helix domain-containing protein [Candidatus Sysuiplasma superficiale]MBX8643180.1 helix-turn-helix domain-containing protein [Candidatus Sysuiplasma superficiale]MCL4346734.1 helix-turn-helix domain-containing protein [Candidatus Thermoplasmatota archaeon]